MSKLSARGGQVFVAGALAFWGFREFIWLPEEFSFGTNGFVWVSLLISSLVSCCALPIGLAIFLGNKQAIHWARVYLKCFLFLGIFGLVGMGVLHFTLPKGSPQVSLPVGETISLILTNAVLLWLLNSRRFQVGDEVKIP